MGIYTYNCNLKPGDYARIRRGNNEGRLVEICYIDSDNDMGSPLVLAKTVDKKRLNPSPGAIKNNMYFAKYSEFIKEE